MSIFHQHWYTCTIPLSLRRNPQHGSGLTVVSASSVQPFHHSLLSNGLERISRPICVPLSATNTSHRKQETFLHVYLLRWVVLPTKKQSRKLLLCSILLKHGRQFDYWNQPLNMPMRVCYLDRREAGLCCYLLIHIESLLLPLLPIVTYLLILRRICWRLVIRMQGKFAT
jgi:hypothetical protein